ncbi:MAG: LytTR family DNA-binding domain-containing protein [Cyclobacteriaceae bacterium]
MNNYFAKTTKILQQPFPSYHFSIRQVGICILSGLLIFLVFYFAQPFNINKLQGDLQLTYSLVYGGVTLLCLLVLTVVLPFILASLFDEENWNVKKEIVFILLTIVVIAIGNLLANHLLEGAAINVESFTNFLFATILIGSLPITLSVLAKQRLLLKKYSIASILLNERLSQIQSTTLTITPPNNIVQEKILLKGDNQDEQLEVLPENIWQLSTADNYVSILYQDGSFMKTILLRSTLKRMEDSLEKFNATLIRCHRSHIVNITKIENTVATAQGLKLKLKLGNQLIPVGKTYLDAIKEKLQSIN